jgi:hypothetical protein
MCYAVACSKCGKTSWAGCGKHVPGVYNTVADKEKDLCLCKSWPDVELPPELAAKIQEPATVSPCLNPSLSSKARSGPAWSL